VVNTSISSSWTTDSETFARYGDSNGTYYYEAFEVTVPSNGDYILKCNSSIDTVGYLYKENFFSNLPLLNLFQLDDDSGGDFQFQITAYLKSGTRYILVATTIDELTTESYTLLVSGLARVNLLQINSTSIISTTTTTGESILFTFFFDNYTIIIQNFSIDMSYKNFLVIKAFGKVDLSNRYE
jgi:hypothetical protein